MWVGGGGRGCLNRFYVEKRFCWGSETYKVFGPCEGLRNSKTLTRATDIQQFNPSGPDQRRSIEPQPIVLNMFRLEPSFRLRHDPPACNERGNMLSVIGLNTKHALCRISMHSVA